MSLNRFEINQTYLNKAGPPVTALSLLSLPAGPTPSRSHPMASPPLSLFSSLPNPCFSSLHGTVCARRSRPRAPRRAKLPFIFSLAGSLLRFEQERRSALRHGLLPRRCVPPPNVVFGMPELEPRPAELCASSVVSPVSYRRPLSSSSSHCPSPTHLLSVFCSRPPLPPPSGACRPPPVAALLSHGVPSFRAAIADARAPPSDNRSPSSSMSEHRRRRAGETLNLPLPRHCAAQRRRTPPVLSATPAMASPCSSEERF
jgi:hypothetical protein